MGSGAKAAEPAGGGVLSVSPAAIFGMREDIEQMSLSPDGGKVAFIAPAAGQGSYLVVRGVEEGAVAKIVARASGNPDTLGRCGWVSNIRLVCTIFGVVDIEGRKVNFSRLLAVDADGGNVRQLGTRRSSNSRGLQLTDGEVIDWLPGEEGAVLMARTYLPDDATGTRIGSSREGYGVDRIDTMSLAAKSVEGIRPEANEYISDGHGTVRIMGTMDISGATGMMTGVTRYLYRRAGSRGWEKLSDYDSRTGQGFNPYAVDRELNIAYGMMKLDGRDALYSMALDGSGKQTLIFSHPKVDVSGLSRVGRRKRVIGATYSTEINEVVYFDPEMAALAKTLGRALSKAPLLRLVDSSIDERKLLIFAGSDQDAGFYYLLDRDKRDLHIFLPARGGLEGAKLGEMKAVTYPAADGTIIPAYLTLPPGKENAKGLPAIVMPHGGPSSRDEWGFDWLSQFYAYQGFAVLQPQFRGSAGYGDAWYQKNGFRSWRTAIGDVADAGRWLVGQGIADPAKLGIVGWSYGGYAALQSAAVAPDLFKAVVAIAPVTDLAMLKAESVNWTDNRLVRDFIGTGPEVREASPTQNAAKIKAPVLLFHGTLDANVGYGQSTAMESRLRGAGGKVQLVTFPNLDHQLRDNSARKQLLEESEAFLRAAMK
jgi:dienelactone hydrolase